MYLILKHTHLIAVVFSFSLFFLRGLWMFADSPQLQKRWVKVVPHVIDTILLASAIALAVLIHQYPFVHTWLTAKLIALVIYIGLGTVAIKRGRSKSVRALAWVGALLTFGYIVAVALTRNPLPSL